MQIRKITKALVLVIASSGAFALGCELIVDFDRTKIPVEDASVPDSSFEAGPLSDAAGTGDSAAPDAADTGSPDVVDSGTPDAPDAD
jgi:hypothetical protein